MMKVDQPIPDYCPRRDQNCFRFPILTGPSLLPEDRFFKISFEGLTDHKSSLAIDLKDEGDHFLGEADMPGIAKDQIKPTTRTAS